MRYLIALCLAATFAVSEARAFELFGIRLFGKADDATSADQQIIDPKRYSVEFVTVPEEPKEIAEAVRNVSELWRGRDAPVGGSAGLLARAKGDYSRILAALYNEARYSGTISITVNGTEAANLPAGTQLPDTSVIRIRVEPGDSYRFGVAEVENPAPAPQSKDDQVESPSEAGFAPGQPARAGVVRKAGALAREAWRHQGYAKAKIVDRQATADHSKDELDVTLAVDEGRRAVYGDIAIEGTERVVPGFVIWQTGLLAGQQYDPDDLARARKRLDRLDVFSVTQIQEAETINADGTLPLTIVVREKKRHRIGAGLTFSTIDGAGAEAYWLHRNLFGRAERLELKGKVSGLGNTFDHAELDYFAGATFTKPGVISPMTDLVADVFGKREFNDTYEETSAGGSLMLSHILSEKITLSGGVFGKYGEFVDTFGTRNFLTTGLVGNASYDGRNSKVDPTRGFYARAEVKPFYEWEYANAAVRGEIEGRTYVAFDDDARFVLAARARVGSIVGPSISQTPPDMLFFAGGGGSVRGYGYKNIGVVTATGAVIGGRSLVDGSLEARVKFTDTIGAVAFADAGVVGSDSFVDFDQDVKIGVGLGVRYYTSLGPIRLDFAVPLDPGPDDPDFGIYAGIGQAF